MATGACRWTHGARDRRNRFLAAAVLLVPIPLWSPIGRDAIGFDAGVRFGLRDDVFSQS